MKILVVSDTHGDNRDLIEKVKLIKKPDLMFHLGDYVGDGLTISKALGIRPVIVLGNGDHPSSGFKEEEIVQVKGKKILLTHGHKLGVKFNLNRVFYRAKELEVDMALFGHTHIPIIEQMEECIIMNPGSPSFPRGFSHKKTFAIIEIDKEIKIDHIEIG